MGVKERRPLCDTHRLAAVAVVRILAGVVTVGVLTMAYLSIRDGRLLEGLSQVTTGALSALVALLAQTRSEPLQTTVTNEPDDPVPTEDVK